MAEEKKVAAYTLDIIINALKFYYGEILRKNFIYEVMRLKKDKKLPVVLSRKEVKKMLQTTENIKHKAILMLIYFDGLLVGKAVRLRSENIDTNWQLINIRVSKGRKDRYTLLFDVALQILQEYRKKEKNEKWLFLSWN
ncbi:MAG: integrase/recombinase XerD [Geotoga sp.]|nr:integrase/recombinase XerD [Geotoga sp.]